MDIYYHVKFQLCITSGSRVSMDVQNCSPPPRIGCVQTPPGIGLNQLMKAPCLHFYHLLDYLIQFVIHYYHWSIVRRRWLRLQEAWQVYSYQNIDSSLWLTTRPTWCIINLYKYTNQVAH